MLQARSAVKHPSDRCHRLAGVHVALVFLVRMCMMVMSPSSSHACPFVHCSAEPGHCPLDRHHSQKSLISREGRIHRCCCLCSHCLARVANIVSVVVIASRQPFAGNRQRKQLLTAPVRVRTRAAETRPDAACLKYTADHVLAPPHSM